MDAGPSRRLVAEGKYEFSKHAEREREADMIPVRELEEALEHCEIIESTPMILGGRAVWCWGSRDNARSTRVCSIRQDPEELFLITVYDPSRRPEHWRDQYRRRRR
jgi:hypothetical protein